MCESEGPSDSMMEGAASGEGHQQQNQEGPLTSQVPEEPAEAQATPELQEEADRSADSAPESHMEPEQPQALPEEGQGPLLIASPFDSCQADPSPSLGPSGLEHPADEAGEERLTHGLAVVAEALGGRLGHRNGEEPKTEVQAGEQPQEGVAAEELHAECEGDGAEGRQWQQESRLPPLHPLHHQASAPSQPVLAPQQNRQLADSSSSSSDVTGEMTRHGEPGSLGCLPEATRSMMLVPSGLVQECPVHSCSQCLLHFSCQRHIKWPASECSAFARAAAAEAVSKWRQKERLKTSSVALVVCLNIGVDPPDVIKISPCARLECWVDPLAMPSQKALETIGKNLQAQYERWQPRAKYKMHLDPTTEDMKKLCIGARRNAKGERMLFHYNGHGVPRPTVNGEIWVFNKNYTQYIPLSIYDLQAWVGTPAIYVFDCSAAGLIVNTFKLLLEQRHMQQLPPGHAGRAGMTQGNYDSPASASTGGGDSVAGNPGAREVILLAACGANELLPQSPDLPADVFTACLTTPIKVALRWFCSRSLLRNEGLSKDQIDRIPGKQTDRKTLLGELNWIFTAITDTIAWNVLPRALFQKLFRQFQRAVRNPNIAAACSTPEARAAQDLLVASLFRNFLLAERIMRATNCSPVSYPQLPPTHQHPMWQAWDMAAERCLAQLPELLAGDGSAEFQPSPFFSEQLTAFEIWLQYGSKDKKPPEQLPIVLQVLLSQVHRMRALLLLGRFLDMGSWAVDLALSVGIFPYVLKLLQTTATDLRQILVFIWTKILALDKSCQVDLVKDNGHLYFIKFLDSTDPSITPASRAMAAFVVATICDSHSKGQMLCANAGLLGVCLSLLPPSSSASSAATSSPALQKWLLLCIGKLCENMPEIASMALRDNAVGAVANMLSVDDAEVRAAAVFALGSFIMSCEHGDGMLDSQGGSMQENERLAAEREIACYLIKLTYDGSPLVRAEVALALSRIASGHSVMMQDAVMSQVRHSTATSKNRVRAATSQPASFSSDRGSDAAGSEGETALALKNHQVSKSSSPDHLAPYPQSSQHHQDVSSSHTAPVTAFPGICVASRASGLLPAISLHQCPVQQPAAPSWASADAARVGSGIYEHLCQAMFLLALDPVTQVASLGRSALEACNVELKLVVPDSQADSSGSGSAAGGSTRGATGTAGAMGMFRRFTSSTSSVHSGQGGSSTTEKATAASSSGVVVHSALPRYVLRKIRQRGSFGSGAEGMRPDETFRGGPSGRVGYSSLDSSPLQEAMALGDFSSPVSAVYALSAEALSSPLLPLSGGDIAKGEVDMLRVPVNREAITHHQSIHEPESRSAMVAAAGLGAAGLKLKEAVTTLETDGEGTAVLHFSPFDPLLTCVDYLGVCRTYSTQRIEAGAKPVNRFHAADASSASASEALDSHSSSGDVAHIFQLNELHGAGLLGVCSLDGTVRIWRNHDMRGQQSMATAFQAVQRPPVLDSGGGGFGADGGWWPAAFTHGMGGNLLFASGGSHPMCVNVWDLTRELCVQQVVVSPGPGLLSGLTVSPIQVLCADREQPLLAVGCSGGAVQLLDLRTKEHLALKIQSHSPDDSQGPPGSDLVGLALRPEGLPGARLVTAAANGMLKLWDIRRTGDPSSPTKAVKAHSPTSGLSVLAWHPHAPLLATATKTHTLKVWTATGENIGAMRAASGGFLGAGKSGAINCLQFHPYNWKLAAGGDNNVVAIYTIGHR